MMLGRTEISFVADTEVRGRREDFFPGSGWTGGEVIARVGSFLIRTPERTVLVDLGLGPGGALLDNLGRHDVTPADVGLVVFTHLHRDHVGWTGAFPNARYLVDESEWVYWRDRPGGVGPDADRVLAPLAGAVGFLAALPPGLEAIAAPGHTPGHTCLLVTDPRTADRVLLLGDLLHHPAQFDHPGRHFRSDVDPALAVRSRREVLARFRDARTVLAGAHF
jgi:glyoxylase-like metal-dependent hydrolase (beta-lactamase superfamily II)